MPQRSIPEPAVQGQLGGDGIGHGRTEIKGTQNQPGDENYSRDNDIRPASVAVGKKVIIRQQYQQTDTFGAGDRRQGSHSNCIQPQLFM